MHQHKTRMVSSDETQELEHLPAFKISESLKFPVNYGSSGERLVS